MQILELVVLILFESLGRQAAQVLDLALQLGALGLQGAALTHQRLQCLLLILHPITHMSQVCTHCTLGTRNSTCPCSAGCQSVSTVDASVVVSANLECKVFSCVWGKCTYHFIDQLSDLSKCVSAHEWKRFHSLLARLVPWRYGLHNESRGVCS